MGRSTAPPPTAHAARRLFVWLAPCAARPPAFRSWRRAPPVGVPFAPARERTPPLHSAKEDLLSHPLHHTWASKSVAGAHRAARAAASPPAARAGAPAAPALAPLPSELPPPPVPCDHCCPARALSDRGPADRSRAKSGGVAEVASWGRKWEGERERDWKVGGGGGAARVSFYSAARRPPFQDGTARPFRPHRCRLRGGLLRPARERGLAGGCGPALPLLFLPTVPPRPSQRVPARATATLRPGGAAGRA